MSYRRKALAKWTTLGHIKKPGIDVFQRFKSAENSKNLVTERYAQQLLNFLYQAWLREEMCDFTLHCRGKSFPLHRVVLAANSSLFSKGMLSDEHEAVMVDGVGEQTAVLVLRYLYTGELSIPEESTDELILLCHQLCLDGLMGKLETLGKPTALPELPYSVSNVLTNYRKARKLNHQEEIHRTCAFIRDNLAEVSRTPAFCQLPFEVVFSLFEEPVVRQAEEVEVFRALVRWLETSADRTANAASLMGLVRFQLMKPAQLAREVEPHPLMAACRPLIMDAFRFHALAEDPGPAEGVATQQPGGPACSHCPAIEEPVEEVVLTIPLPQRPFLVAVYGKRIFAFQPPELGGPTGDPQAWVEIAALPEYLNHPAVAYYDDFIYVIGGADFRKKESTNKGLRYSLSHRRWQKICSMQECRSYASAEVLENRIYVVGGRDECKRMLNSAEVYDPEHDRWTLAAPANAPCVGASMCEHLGTLYRFGGYNTKETLCITEVYDPEKDRWMLKTPMEENTAFSSVASIGGRQMFVVGGADYSRGYVPHGSIWCYRPLEDCWVKVNSLLYPRYDHGIVTLGDRLYAIAGLQEQNKGTFSAECYDVRAECLVEGTFEAAPREGPVFTCVVPALDH